MDQIPVNGLFQTGLLQLQDWSLLVVVKVVLVEAAAAVLVAL
jgi:hypothetical protein